MFEMGDASANTLPSEFSNKKLYESTHGITGVSDPNWSTLAGYYNSFRNLTTPDTNPTFAVKPGAALHRSGACHIQSGTGHRQGGHHLQPGGQTVDQDVGWIRDPNGTGGSMITGESDFHAGGHPSQSLQCQHFLPENAGGVQKYPGRLQLHVEKATAVAAVSQSVIPGTFESFNTMATGPQKSGNRELDGTTSVLS